MTIPIKAPFYATVDFAGFPKSTRERMIEIVDDYFFLGGRKVVVVIGQDLGKSQNAEWIHAQPSMVSTLLKVISYFTLIIPLIMLVLKTLLRSGLEFYIVKSARQDPPSSVPPSSVPPSDLPAQKAILEEFTSKKPTTKDSSFLEQQPASSLPPCSKSDSATHSVISTSLANDSSRDENSESSASSEKSKIAALEHTKLLKQIVPLVVKKKYSEAIAILEIQPVSISTQNLVSYVERNIKRDHVISLIEESNVTQALSLINELESEYEKDDMLKKAIKLLAERGYFQQAVDLLDQKFCCEYAKEVAVKELARGLKIDTRVLEDDNRIAIAKFFLKNKKYSLANKIAMGISKHCYSKEKLLKEIETYLLHSKAHS